MGEKTETIKASSSWGLINLLLNGPFAVLVVAGIGVWGASNMTEAQVHTLLELVTILDNPLGWIVGCCLLLFFCYALFFYPVGKFFSDLIRQYTSSQLTHNSESQAHFAASKEMYASIGAIKDELEDNIEYHKTQIIPVLSQIASFYKK